MLFSSWTFLVCFLPAAFFGFSIIPGSWEHIRKVWLIAASLVFYGYWKLEYVPLLLASVLVNYGIAEGISRCHQTRAARHLLIFGVALNLLVLGCFKYTNFAIHFFGLLAHQKLAGFDIVLPLAISFFTFTQISYLVDVYRDRSVHYSFLDYSLFVVFFPHLIAGPIVRHWEIIPQFASHRFQVTRDNFGVGITLFILGLCKKHMADGAAIYADAVYNGAAHGLAVSSCDAWIGTVAFSLQIYFDFSSYSDMAIGLARMFGIRFPYNFDSPYQASSIIAFWERWHRTLTRFLREYVYFGLGGNRKGYARQIGNIMATMFLSGLWHGAGLTFVLWGVLHGGFIVINHTWRLWAEKLKWSFDHPLQRAAGVLLTFIVVTLAWTFFRAPNIHVAGLMLEKLLALDGFHFVNTGQLEIKNYGDALGTIAALLLICWAMPNTQQLLARYEPIFEAVKRPGWFQITLGFWTALGLGLLGYLLLRNSYVIEPSPFIYFNF